MNDQQQKNIGEMIDILKTLSAEELSMTYGYALGLKAKRDTENQPG